MLKALVVDESRAVRMILRKTLQELGYEVLEASNGREALEVIEAGKTTVTLVRAGGNAPERNGLDLLKQLRRKPEASSLVVVMVSTGTGLNQMAAALEGGSQRIHDQAIHPPLRREWLCSF